MNKILPSLASIFVAFLGCVPAGDGVSPPPKSVYFPVGLRVDAKSEWLYVVNSNFDLQYNQGTVQSVNLARVRSLARQPCSENADCQASEFCDMAPSQENGGEPSFFCVDTSGEFAGLPCGAVSENRPQDRALSPGRCGPVDLLIPPDKEGPLLEAVVEISAFATGAVVVSSPDEVSEDEPTERMFVPVRGDLTVHWLDLRDGRIDCGQESVDEPLIDDDGELVVQRCSDSHKIGRAPDFVQAIQPLPEDDKEKVEDLEVAPEPYEIATTTDGRVLVMTHQTNGTLSTFINDWTTDPFLVHQLVVDVANPMFVATLPTPRLVDELSLDYQAGFLMTTRSAAEVSLLRFFDDGAFDRLEQAAEGTLPEEGFDRTSRPGLYDVGTSAITANSNGYDSRGIAVDDTRRREAEAACSPDDADCLHDAASIPMAVYVANRSPNSLLVGATDASETPVAADDLPTFHDNIPLTQGPSRVVIGKITDIHGEKQTRVFVLCFDSALIYVYDPVRRVVESEIYTGRGPHDLAFDGEEPLLYVAHFTDSYLGVVSLDQRHPRTYGAMVATLATPTPPRAAK